MINKRIFVSGIPYEIEEELGHGLHSTVYSAQNLLDRQSVAIKIIRFISKSRNISNRTESDQQIFWKEFRMLLYLQPLNPYVIRIFNYDYNNHYGTIVMERGKTFRDTLAEHLRTKTLMSKYDIRRFWSQMVSAIYFMHRIGIVHGDCKPENFIQVGSDGTTLRLIDMGISFQLPPNVTSRIITAAGTPGKSTHLITKSFFFFSSSEIDYVAPEMINSRIGTSDQSKYGYKADIWALGVILFEMTFGFRPLQVLGDSQIKLRFLEHLCRDINIPDYPDKYLRDILQRCLCSNHCQRADIEELINHPFLNGIY